MPKGVPVARPRSKIDISHITMEIIRKYQPEMLNKLMPFDIERFYEFDLTDLTGVRPVYEELPLELHGYTDIEQMKCVISNRLADDVSRIQFFRSTVAHEVGHAVMHVREFRQRKTLIRLIHNQEDASLRLYHEEDIPPFRNPEWQAWWFAKSLLMPGVMVRKAVEDGYDVYDLAQTFQVYPAFVLRRLRDLRISL
ncbi:MAG TPA: ImmA/IrrE family metallo-endopeptidase [Blastocatellia bacterium]|nr:ImmA/IrrE family metallo-endopeptidase [Blastocatellia bacterium]